MVRLTHLSGSLQGTCSMSPKAVIRIGRGAACDVRFDPHVDARVSAYHAEIRFSQGHYVIVDVGSSNGTLLNGKVVRQHRLRSGDRLRFGAEGGPEVRFEIDDSVEAVQSYSNGSNGRPASQLIQPIAPPLPRPPRMAPGPPFASDFASAQWQKPVELGPRCGFRLWLWNLGLCRLPRTGP